MLDRSRMQKEVREWLGGRPYTHFVTLTTQRQDASRLFMEEKLKTWDAHCNRGLLNSKWKRKPDERLAWVAFPEKAGVNPHWHLLLHVLPEQWEKFEASDTDGRFVHVLTESWEKLVSSGTVNVKVISEQQRLINYITKEYDWDWVVTSNQFNRID